VDDMAEELMNSDQMQQLFIRTSHHAKISVIFTAQLFYVKTTKGRAVPTQVTHHVIFKWVACSSVCLIFETILFIVSEWVENVILCLGFPGSLRGAAHL
jgi:hypothetical protein